MQTRFTSIFTRAAMTLLLMMLTSINAWADELIYVGYLDPTAAIGAQRKTVTNPTQITAETTAIGTADTETWYYVSGEFTNSNRIEVRGTVNLILEDGCDFTASKGLHVPSGNALNIYAQSIANRGSLTADNYALPNYAAIGGNGGISQQGNGTSGEAAGDITIYGGTIKTTNGNIGGGNGGNGFFEPGEYSDEPGHGGKGGNGNVTIYSGYITVNGNIGGGSGGTGQNDWGSEDPYYYGSNGDGIVNLSWTNTEDQICADNYYGTVTLQKAFDGFDAGVVGNNDLLIGQSLVYAGTCYTVTIGSMPEGVTATADLELNAGFKDAVEGQVVTICFSGVPAGKVPVATVNYTNAYGDQTDNVIDNGDGTYSFTMPAANVTISAGFEIIQFVVDGLTYEWNDAVPNSVMVIDCELGENESITIPNTVEHNGVTYDVTAIYDGAFVDKTTLTSITFPAKLVSIGSCAFKDCTALSVTIPAGVTLGSEAFNRVCSVTALLADDSDNSALISSYIGAVMNVSDTYITLSGRTLLKDGSWNTLCLPFSLTAGNIANSPLAGATIKELDNSADGTNLTDGTLTLKFTDATEIEAGKPYIVKWTTTGNAITNPTFSAPAFDNSDWAQANMTVTSYDQNVKFVGQWSPFTIGDTSNGTYDGDINEILYIASGNKIGYSSKARTLKSCRAHFWVKPNGTQQAARMINVDFGDETTGISDATRLNKKENITNNNWYTLDGQKLDKQPTAKGVYIHNGRKEVVK